VGFFFFFFFGGGGGGGGGLECHGTTCIVLIKTMKTI